MRASILEYAQEMGWTFVALEEAEIRRGVDPYAPPADRAINRSLFIDAPLDTRCSNSPHVTIMWHCPAAAGFRHLHIVIYGARDFVDHVRNRAKFFDHEENRERDVIMIDYEDRLFLPQER